MRLAFPNAVFDIVICSHVLEHVSDDIAAMRELRRVLKTDGWAAIQVPVFDGPTIEGSPGLDPETRRVQFGQADHVRRYGSDYLNRLAAAGLSGRRVFCDQLLAAQEVSLLALNAAEELAICAQTPD